MAPLAAFRVELSIVGYGPKAVLPLAIHFLSDGKVRVSPASTQHRRLEITFTQKNCRYYAPYDPILLPPFP